MQSQSRSPASNSTRLIKDDELRDRIYRASSQTGSTLVLVLLQSSSKRADALHAVVPLPPDRPLARFRLVQETAQRSLRSLQASRRPSQGAHERSSPLPEAQRRADVALLQVSARLRQVSLSSSLVQRAASRLHAEQLPGRAAVLTTAARNRSRLQVKRYSSVLDCARRTYAEEGIRGFFRGGASHFLSCFTIRSSRS